MFTIYLHTEKSKLNNKEVNEDKYWIRPLLPGVRLKLKGQRSISGEIGEDWKLSREQMLSSTVIRGSYWWKFNAFETSNNLNDILNPRTWEDRQNRQVLKSVGIFSLLFTIFALVVGLWPQQKKVLQKVEEIPVVKFIAPKKKMILESPVQKPPEKKAAAPVAQVPASNLKSEVRVEEKKQTKEKVSKPPILKPVPNEPKIQMPPPAPKPDPRKMAAEAAAKKMASLRSLLGGALNITKTPVVNKLQSNRAAPVFGNSGSPIAATQIRPGYVSTRGGVGAVGGSSQGGASYASGERAVVGSGKATFVPVDSGGVSVEQGLTQEEVGAVIYSHLAEVRYCHDTAVLYTPRLEGKLLVKFSINGQGRVVKAGVESSDLPEHMLEKCILKKLATWKFPIPKGGIVVSVGYPFIFKTLGRE
jgi:outer membrane biosynthesis protein TonB